MGIFRTEPEVLQAPDGKPGHPISAANLCRNCGIVTAHAKCPNCTGDVIPHPERGFPPPYCVKCANRFPLEKLRVITWEADPYTQLDDGDLILACVPCLNREERI
jgi:hypothetical protein